MMKDHITALVNANKATKQVKDEKVRFIIEMTPQERERLRTLCKDKLGCGEIKFASELFGVALTDAEGAYEEAVKAAQAQKNNTPAPAK